MNRIVHLGLGNFHRAHQAAYTHAANAIGPERWTITGVAMRNAALRDAMAAEGGAYDLGILGPDGLSVERIAVHDRLLVAAEDAGAILEALAAPDTRAVTLTVTEKGYGLDASGALDPDNPAIAADLRQGAEPRTPVGLLAHALARRHGMGAPPLTILSCDNLSENGTRLRAAVAAFLDRIGAAPGALDRAAFPSTMVDRITPATTPGIAARMAEAAGRPVTAPVLTEAFTDWVIEDTAAGPLPDWRAAGALFVRDVAAYERRKLLILNAAHSALAYGGLLAGHTFVHEAIADPALRARIDALWTEASALLPGFGAGDLAEYQSALVARFSVAGMEHRLAQIAMDGTSKLPQRILPILRQHGLDAPASTRVLTDWWRLTERRIAEDTPLDDPMADALRKAATGDSAADRFSRALGVLAPGAWPEGWAARALAHP